MIATEVNITLLGQGVATDQRHRSVDGENGRALHGSHQTHGKKQEHTTKKHKRKKGLAL